MLGMGAWERKHLYIERAIDALYGVSCVLPRFNSLLVMLASSAPQLGGCVVWDYRASLFIQSPTAFTVGLWCCYGCNCAQL